MKKQDFFDTIFAIITGDIVALGTGVFGVGIAKIKMILMFGTMYEFGFLICKTFLLAVVGGFGGLLSKWIWNFIKSK